MRHPPEPGGEAAQPPPQVVGQEDPCGRGWARRPGGRDRLRRPRDRVQESTGQSSHRGRPGSNGRRRSVSQVASSCASSAGGGSGWTRTWWARSSESTSTQSGRPRPRRGRQTTWRSRGSRGSRRATAARTASIRRPPPASNRPSPASTAIAPMSCGQPYRCDPSMPRSWPVRRSSTGCFGGIIRTFLSYHQRCRPPAYGSGPNDPPVPVLRPGPGPIPCRLGHSSVAIGRRGARDRPAGRLRARAEPRRRYPAGVRTFALAALAGCLAALAGTAVLAAVTVAAAGLVAVGYARTSARDPGATTEIALVLTVLLGGVAVSRPALAAGAGVATAIVLVSKDRLHRFVRQTVSDV